jgi:hypothetical protein
MIHPLLRKTLKCISTGLLVSLTTLPATAQEDDTTLQKNYEKLQSQFEQLSGDMAKLQSQIKKQESSLDRKIEDKLAAQEAVYVERVERLEATQAGGGGSLLSGTSGNSFYHIAGYADVGYTDADDGVSSFNTGHFAPIFHYQYKEILLLEAELAFGSETNEEGETETETELEYLTLDLFINDYMTLVAGKFLSPIGQFQQNLHPSWINKLASMPIGFGAGHGGASQATPIGDVGVQLRGGIPVKDMRINYAVFVGNGPRIIAEEHMGDVEIEGLDTSGTASDLNGNKSVGSRLGFLPLPNLEIGVSALTASAAYVGDEMISDRDYDVYGMDFYYAPGYIDNLTLRGEYVKTELGAGSASEEDAAKKTWEAWYLQASYFMDQYKLEPVLRYGEYEDAHGETKTQWAPGLNYRFSSNIIGKVGYEFNDTNGDEGVSDRFTLQLAYGF